MTSGNCAIVTLSNIKTCSLVRCFRLKSSKVNKPIGLMSRAAWLSNPTTTGFNKSAVIKPAVITACPQWSLRELAKFSCPSWLFLFWQTRQHSSAERECEGSFLQALWFETKRLVRCLMMSLWFYLPPRNFARLEFFCKPGLWYHGTVVVYYDINSDCTAADIYKCVC